MRSDSVGFLGSIPRDIRFVCLHLFATASLIGSAAGAQTVKPELFAGMAWRNIGPNRSGYITSPAGIPGDPTTYYVGTPEGGVWKTTNAGTTWFPVFDQMHVASIGAVAVAPSDHNVVYVGTGNSSGWSFTTGDGVYKSTDAGRTWTNIGLNGSADIGAIVVDPRNANVVLVAAQGGGGRGGGGARGGAAPAAGERGVYRSTDGGRNWQAVLPKDGSAGATDLIMDYADPSIVYATISGGAGGRGGAAGAVAPAPGALAGGAYKSVDGGVTWNPVGGQGLPGNSRPTSIAVAGGTHGQRLYTRAGGGRGGGGGAAGGAGGPSGIYRSDNGGASWTFGTGALASAGGKYYADTQNPDVVYLMGTSMYRSTDAGKTFTSYMGAPSGADIRFLWIDPTSNKRMLIGSDQGPTISVDGGESWSLWFNMAIGQFYRVSTDNVFPYHVCGPQQDSGTACVLSRSDFGEIRPNDWAPIGGFENGYVTTDPLDNRYVYTQGWYHVLRRFDRVTSQVTTLYTPSNDDRFGGAPPLAFSPQDPHTLYMGAQYVLASSDNAQTWRKISPDLTVRANVATDTSLNSTARRTGPTAGGSISALVPSSISAGTIWVGAGSGMVQLTRDGGTTWNNVSPANAVSGSINILDASHSNPGGAYIAINTGNRPHIYRTADFGKSWQEIVAGISDSCGVRTVREDPVDPNLLYAGTVKGTWVSFDKGDHWQSLQLNLPTTVISDMTVHGSDLVISTYGRGFWILDDVTPLRQIRAAMAATATAFLFKPDTASRALWDNTEDTPLLKEMPTGQNPPEGAILDYYLKTPVTGPITISISDAAGHTIRSFSNVAPPQDSAMLNVPAYWVKPPTVLSTAPGMHRIAWDLRYDSPPTIHYAYTGAILDYNEFTLNWHAIPGNTPLTLPLGPMVVPGNYFVKLTVAGQVSTQPLTVVKDPRVPASTAAVTAQFQLEQRMMAGLKSSFDGFNEMQRLSAALSSAMLKSPGKSMAGEIITSAAALDSVINSLVSPPTGVRGFGSSNRDLARRLADMEFGDVQPSPSVVSAAEGNCKDIDAAIAIYRKTRTSFAALDALLSRAQLPALPDWTPPATACGTTP